MSGTLRSTQRLLTLPPRMAEQFANLENKPLPGWFASSDPAGQSLGSGGGTAQLLVEAWHATGGGQSFQEWLRDSSKMVLHAGGQSRRLPAYAAVGKLLIPIPVFRWARGQRLDQSLLDLQLPEYERLQSHAGGAYPLMICSGDVMLRFGSELPDFPQVDVLGVGMWVSPEQAQDFGVFFTPRNNPGALAFFLQKPSAAKIRELAADHLALVDTGVWLLSEKAVNCLLRKCGWQEDQFTGGASRHYELYAGFGLSLGQQPTVPDAEIGALTSAVVPLPGAQFYHFGTNAQLIESVSRLQTLELDERKIGLMGAVERPDQVNQNSRFGAVLRRGQNESLWLENAAVPSSWHLESRHIITGVPANTWQLRLAPGDCLDCAPIGQSALCLRPYGFNDTFAGLLGGHDTRWINRPVLQWFEARKLLPEECGLQRQQDIQDCALFPVFEPDEISGEFVQWLLAAEPGAHPEHAASWKAARRLSAREIGARINLERLYAQRETFRQECLLPMLKNFRSSVFFRLDLESTAQRFARGSSSVPELAFTVSDDPMHTVHDRMFRSAVLRHRGDPSWELAEKQAFAQLRERVVQEAQLSPALPVRSVLEDQIVWARSPVRLDLAGGWSDTPPYCLEHGGCVLNLAVDLNGQPPIQVFARVTDRPELVMRSIDLGSEERARTYAELDTFAQPTSAFALAKAALALAGFLPRFHAQGGAASLSAQLKTFGGGIELSLLSGVPKGSGLGASSILSATVLASLNDLCGLGWDKTTLFTRTLALEQMLTTGGGWQDQAGAIFRGIKLIETQPGLRQQPMLSWLPSHLFGGEYANRSILLYYTGITRLAKNILGEIVRGLFLNSPGHLACIEEIARNARTAAAAVQQCDYDALVASVRRSWELNCRLDPGTCPTAVREILDRVEPYTRAVKLLGAGGGGYLVMFARDAEAGERLRQELTARPPNPRARFVGFGVSETGLQVTRS